MPKNKLSYSRVGCFDECPKKFKYRYIDKLYPEKTPSPLFFGNVIDDALNYVLACKKNNEKMDEDKLWQIYDDLMTAIDPNLIDYFNSDVSLYCLNEKDIEKMMLVDPEFREMCLSTQKKQTDYIKWFKQTHTTEFNYLAWISIYRKGIMMIETFLAEVIDLFDEISTVQDTLKVDNGEGDTLTCVIDFTTATTLNKLLDNEHTIINADVDPNIKHTIIMDNKTSSRAYLPNSVVTSEQLSIYGEFYHTELCGYVVFDKKIRKDKRMRYQIIIDEVDKEFQSNVFESLQQSLGSIKSSIETNHFPKELDSCFSYGRRCEFYELCKNGNPEGLIKKERK